MHHMYICMYITMDCTVCSVDVDCLHSNSSDVVLISEDGKRFHAHRLVLCAQSAVFKAMMASQEWGTSKRNEVCPGGA